MTHKLDSSAQFRIVEGSLIQTSRTEYIFEQDKDIHPGWNFNNELQIWEPRGYSVKHYINDLLFKQTYNNWDGDYSNLGEKDPQILRKFFYNKQNKVQSLWTQNELSIEANHLSSLDSLIYNSDDQLTKTQQYFWEPSRNELIQKREVLYRHDDNGLLESIVESKYENEFGWYIQDSTYMTYDENDKLEIEDYYSKGPTREEYVYRSRKTYFYNSDGSINEVLYQRGTITEENHWPVTELQEYKYHDYGSLENKTDFLYTDPYASYSFDQLYESDYTHDGNIPIENIRYPRTRFSDYFDNSHYYEKHMLLKEVHYGGGTFFEPRYLDFINEFYYSEITTSSSEELAQHIVNIYPNPSSDYLILGGFDSPVDLEFSLLNMEGKKVLLSIINSNEKISVAHLPSGIYIYTIKYDGKLVSGKLSVN